MASLNNILRNTANAMAVFDQALTVAQNNIANVNTPGYAKQDQSLEAAPFNPGQGLEGGVVAGPLISARSEYLEQAVRSHTEQLGDASQRASDLGQVEPFFDLTSTSGIASSINSFFNAFSQLSVNPNDAVNRQGVIDQTRQLAQSLNSSANGITQISNNIAGQTGSVIQNINQIAAQIATINGQIQANAQSATDAGLDARVHTALENLSELANFTVLKAGDGTYSVSIGGQAPLVLGEQQFQLSADSSSSQTAILDAQGNDITSEITRGRLGALIQERNTTVPGYLNDLNQLAQSLADTVNNQQFQGVDQSGAAPSVGLFTYDQASDAALTLAVANIAPDQVAAASANAPGGNSNATAFAQLANAPSINGFTFTQFYGQLGARVGSDVATAKQDQTQAQSQVTLAQAQRADQSSVSINEEAAKVLQFEQAYQAAGKVVSVIETITQSVIDMVR